MSKFALLVLVVAFGWSSGVSANLISNGSFEQGASSVVPENNFVAMGAGFLPANTIPGWTLISGSIDWVHTGYFAASDGSYDLDMSGAAIAGSIRSDAFSTDVGVEYLLTFDLGGNPWGGPATKNLFVDIGSEQNIEFTIDTAGFTPQDPGWTEIQLSFVATGSSTTATFRSGVGSSYGPLLDNVSVVPEPSTALLLGIGMMGLGMRRTRRGCC